MYYALLVVYCTVYCVLINKDFKNNCGLIKPDSLLIQDEIVTRDDAHHDIKHLSTPAFIVVMNKKIQTSKTIIVL